VGGSASGVFSGGDQRRCDRRPASVLDLSSILIGACLSF